MKTVVLIGLQSTSNLGDRLVYQCTEKILEQLQIELGINDLQFLSCDMLGKPYYKYQKELPQKELERTLRLTIEKELKAKYPTYQEIKKQRRRKFFPRFYRWLDATPKRVERACAETAEAAQKEREAEENHAAQLPILRRKAILSSAASTAKKVINSDTAAVIFVGGGIIKHGHPLCLGHVLAAYVERAEELNIPVMFSAAGVEGYDENDPECTILTETLNRSCVKSVTIRDDLETYLRYYAKNPTIPVRKTACPTCLTKTLFPLGTLPQKKTIGIGMGKPEWFLARNPDLSYEDLIAIWSKIILELERRGYDWQIFCNGMNADLAFGKEILRHLGLSALMGKKVLPAPKSIHQLLDSYNLFEGLIAGRLHTAIPAYSYKIPFVELVWNDKQHFFAEDAGIRDRFFELPDADPVKIVDKLEEAMRNGYPENTLNPDETVDALRAFLQDYVIPERETVATGAAQT